MSYPVGMVAAYSKVHISLSLLLIALTSVVCGTILELNDKSGSVSYAIAGAAATAIAAIAVPAGLAKKAEAADIPAGPV